MPQISELLQSELTLRQGKNQNYSLRAYAKYLGISPTSLSMVLNGKRALSKKALESLLPKLNIPIKMQASFLQQTNGYANREFVEIELQKLRLVSDWYYFAILSLMELPVFKDDVAWISKRLNIKVWQAKQAMSTLEQLGLAYRNKSGKWIPDSTNYKSPDQISSESIKMSHVQALELARYSLEHDCIDDRNFSAMTMAIDTSLIPEANIKIKNFRRKLCHFLESSSNKNQVYRLAIQLFPLSREN